MKKIIFYSACVLFLSSIGLGVGTYMEQSKLQIHNIEALASGEPGDVEGTTPTESVPQNYVCSAGGPGSSSCSISVNGSVGSGGLGVSCSVTCNSSYYACCNAMYNKCQCRKS